MWGLGDASDSYGTALSSYQRLVALAGDCLVVVVDLIELAEAREISWHWHTYGEVEIDDHSALLATGNARWRMEALGTGDIELSVGQRYRRRDELTNTLRVFSALPAGRHIRAHAFARETTRAQADLKSDSISVAADDQLVQISVTNAGMLDCHVC